MRHEAAGVTTAVFYGFGLGYMVEAFRRQFPGVPAVIIEPEACRFAEALRCRDLRSLLAAGELFWHVGEEPEGAVAMLASLPLSGLRVFRLRPLLAVEGEYFRRVEAAIRALLDRREVNLNTLRRFGKLWVRNLVANLRQFAACPGVAQLEGRFQGIPALVLAAGPSLDLLLPELPELRRRLLVIAVDTSYRLCREAGVEPDLLVTVDPQYWNTRHLDWVDVGGTIVVSESSAHPRILRRLEPTQAPLYFVSSFFPLGRLLEEAIGCKGTVGAGGSVATTAWDLARRLGCDAVYAAGLDLGYPGGRTHCRGAYFEELMHQGSSRLAPADTAQLRALREAGAFALPSNSGAVTLTDRRLIIYKWWFENQIAQARSNPSAGGTEALFCLSPEGVRIDGMPYRPPEALAELPVCRPAVDSRLRKIRREAAQHRQRMGDAAPAEAMAILRSLSSDLERLLSLSAEARAACGKLKAFDPSAAGAAEARAALFRELDRLDSEILGLSARNVAGFLFQGLIHRILDSAGGDHTAGEVLEVSEELYRELEGSAAYHLDLIREALRRAGYL